MGRAHDHRQFVPIAELPYCDVITTVVEEFAGANGFQFSPYHQDLPIWIVAEPEFQKKRVRRLQIVGYLVSRESFISFIPSAHLVTDRHTIKVPRETPADRVSLQTFLRKDGGFNRQAFTDRLQTAWMRTADLVYSEENLMEVEISEALCC